MDFKDLEIGDVFYHPYNETSYGFKKISETRKVRMDNGVEAESHPQGAVMKVEVDEQGKVMFPAGYPHVPIELWGKSDPVYKLPPNWGRYGVRISWKDSKISIKQTGMRAGAKFFDVVLDEGEWPADTDLITLCDGSVPPHACHFGGKVSTGAKERRVTLYFD